MSNLSQQDVINISNIVPNKDDIAQLEQPDILSRDFNNNMFKINEQKVQLDIDLYKQTITGITELWVVPNENINFINEIQLDCQNGINVLQVQLVVKKENEEANINDDVEEVLDMEYVHYNPIQENELEMDLNKIEENVLFSGGNSIEEMTYLKNKKYEPKFDPFTTNKDVNDAKLYINMAPFNHKFKPNSNSNSNNISNNNDYNKNISSSSSSRNGNKLLNIDDSMNNNYMTPLVINPTTNKSINTPSTIGKENSFNSNQLQPFTIRISYYIETPKNEGIHFIQTNKNIPIYTCHTTNNLLTTSASNWVPCIDSPNEKCLWEVEIVTVRDLHSHILENPELKDLLCQYENEEVNVITGDITTQNELYISDTNKRTVFTLLNPVSACGVGFSIGFFKNYGFTNTIGDLPVNVWVPQVLKLSNSKESRNKNKKMNSQFNVGKDDEDVDMDNNINNFDKEDDTFAALEEEKIYNSFLTLPKTLEYFNNYFGTFAFNCLNLILLNDLYVDSLSFQGICFLNYETFVYNVSELDPIIENSIKIADLLSVQWFGINITPNSMEDYWIILGIQGFMRLKFIHDILGNNEQQYRLKTYNDYIVQNNENKPSLTQFHKYMSYPIKLDSVDDEGLMKFIKVKAMMVLFILDCKMTKMERSLGIYKIINKLNILSVSGDLNNNCITNQFFQHQVEKTYKGKLNQFFKQWVHNTGVPKFEITQRFNKKKMVIELIIKQVLEGDDDGMEELKKKNTDQKLPDLYKVPNSKRHQIYQGNMTIRIHEADGIPYEHIIHISEQTTRLDIQYNSKYKKLKRGEHRGLGDILITPSELNAWDITPIITFTSNSVINNNNSSIGGDAGVVAGVDEDLIESGSEAYEWIRIDSDFEWIAQIVNFNMKIEMYISQLQLDKDVEAQLQSLDFLEKLIITHENFKKVEEMDLQVSSCLIRCILDERYFYSVRLRAIDVLASYHLKKNFKGGFNHLILIIENLLFDDEGNLKHNDFGNYINYKVVTALINSLNKIVISEDEIDDLENNNILAKIKLISQKLLLFNDNSKNHFNDESCIVLLIDNLVKLIIKFPQDIDFRNSSFKIITKYERLQKWSNDASNKIIKCIMWNKLLLINEGLDAGLFEIYDFVNEIYQTIVINQESKQDLTMITFSFKLLLIIGIKNKDILKHFFIKMVIVYQNNPFLRNRMIDSFIDAVKFIILNNNRILLTAYNEDFESLQRIYNPNLFNDLNKFKKFNDFERFNEPEPKTTFTSSNGNTNSDIILGSNSNQETIHQKNVFLDDEMKIQLQKDFDLKSKDDKESLLQYGRSLFDTFDPLKQILWLLLNKKSLLIDSQKLKLFEFLPLMYKQEKKLYVTLKLPSERPLIMEKGEVTFDEENNCNKFDMKVFFRKKSRYEKKKPVMKFSLNNAQFKIPKIKLKPGRKSKQQKQQLQLLSDASTVEEKPLIIPIKLNKPHVVPPKFYYKTEITRFGSLPLTNVKIDKKRKTITLSSLSQMNDLIHFSQASKDSLIVKLKTKK